MARKTPRCTMVIRHGPTQVSWLGCRRITYHVTVSQKVQVAPPFTGKSKRTFRKRPPLNCDQLVGNPTTREKLLVNRPSTMIFQDCPTSKTKRCHRPFALLLLPTVRRETNMMIRRWTTRKIVSCTTYCRCRTVTPASVQSRRPCAPCHSWSNDATLPDHRADHYVSSFGRVGI